MGNAFASTLVGTVASDDTYPNPGGGVVGGYTLTPQQFGLNVVERATCESLSGLKFAYDAANNKLKAFEFPGDTKGPATELANSDTSARNAEVVITAIGR